MVARRPRIVIVGAGMAGITAANQLQRILSGRNICFDLTVLEANHRIGGRIHTTQFGGDQLEIGATWIHGIEGSPIYDIAQRIGALKAEAPWERQDGFPGKPTMRVEGGFTVDPAIIKPAADLYQKLMSDIQDTTTVGLRGRKGDAETAEIIRKNVSVGAFLRDGLNKFLSQHSSASEIEKLILATKRNGYNPIENQETHYAWMATMGWDLQSLQDAAFSMYENIERIATAVNSLFDLDLESEIEYREYPGDHVTIGKGYVSVLHELASCLPAGAIQFGKKIQKIVWNNSQARSCSPVTLHCEDGVVVNADHVIITVSLGVLKAGTEKICAETVNPSLSGFLPDLSKERQVCRSVRDLATRVPTKKHTCALFEPPLPPWKLDAISRLGFGVVDKLFLEIVPGCEEQLRSYMQLIYKRATSKTGGIPSWMRKTFSFCPIYKESRVLLAWLAGEEALEMENLTDDEIIAGVVDTLVKFGFPGETMCKNKVKVVMQCEEEETINSNSDCRESFEDGDDSTQLNNDVRMRERLRSMFCGVLRSSWGRDPLFYGSYTYVAVGSSGRDLEILAEPLPKLAADKEERNPLQLLFAGEGTHRHFYSTTHGAYLSGLREANRLLHLYGFSDEELV
eukprot:c24861_g1_i1 orf=552-2429(+)